ncbi:flavodoxin family protein [Anaerosporobacter sp.]|uniref:flavodoxin family protein n=1 Tax=Anaerosporobacter sp. TaxID=1872529 RepID=UPI00286F4D5A|nr:flavodoxin family protein [Anaerosporobacter sp.]
MKLIISDVQNLPIKENDNCRIIYDNGNIHHCIGCFGCWVKTPGKCVINDGYENMGKLLSQCEELILISRCTYGGFSPFVKNVLDRAISYISPNFVIRNGEMHHKRRYANVINISAYFYGTDITSSEKETAKKLVTANAVNYDGKVNKITFLDSVDKVKEVLR